MRTYAVKAGQDWQRPSPRQRAGTLALTIAAELLLVLIVILFGSPRARDLVLPTAPTAITFVPNSFDRSADRSPSRAVRREVARKPETVRKPAPTPPLQVPKFELPYVPLSRADMAAGDIAKLGSAANPGRVAEAGSGNAKGVGKGPGGVTLYNAEWVVEPSEAELRTYLPREIEAGSWALIACQTIAHNRVENCAQLGESPQGSGLSKAMRLAAWQFKVRPPRIDGQPMVGAWVRIKIDFGREKDD